MMKSTTTEMSKGSPAAGGLARLLRSLLCILAVSVISLGTPTHVRADEKSDAVDGRLEGFPSQASLPDPGNTVLTWLFFGVLTTLAAGVTFMNSKRSHLD